MPGVVPYFSGVYTHTPLHSAFVPSERPPIQFRVPEEVYDWLNNPGPPGGAAKEIVMRAFDAAQRPQRELPKRSGQPAGKVVVPSGWPAPVVYDNEREV